MGWSTSIMQRSWCAVWRSTYTQVLVMYRLMWCTHSALTSLPRVFLWGPFCTIINIPYQCAFILSHVASDATGKLELSHVNCQMANANRYMPIVTCWISMITCRLPHQHMPNVISHIETFDCHMLLPFRLTAKKNMKLCDYVQIPVRAVLLQIIWVKHTCWKWQSGQFCVATNKRKK